MVVITTLSSRMSSPRRKIAAIVAGEPEIASIIAIKPPSMRLAISISPSRVSNSTVPISRIYIRTGSVVRPNSLSTVDNAASASSSASASVAAVATLLLSNRVSVSGVCSYTATPMSLSMEITTSSVSVSTNLPGKWSEISPWVRYPRVRPSLTISINATRCLTFSSSD